ncbi:DCC1-like thiol-disulfide oxidoreductase family protein [Flavobacteriales bacterium]|nr:DCC1-like thiol-disulfide oxidoreductase family protein [Flavobacteriales bacterium]
MNKKKHIILYDGECTFCSFWVKFVLKRDKKDQFRFASLQSITGIYYTDMHNIDENIDSVILINKDGTSLIKTNAVFEILYLLGGLGKFLYGLKIFPRFTRDFFYDIIAKMRYKLFKRKACELPLNINYKSKFL